MTTAEGVREFGHRPAKSKRYGEKSHKIRQNNPGSRSGTLDAWTLAHEWTLRHVPCVPWHDFATQDLVHLPRALLLGFLSRWVGVSDILCHVSCTCVRSLMLAAS